VQRACTLTGTSRATYYRQAKPRGPRHGPWRARTPPPQALSIGERDQVLALLNSPAYADLAIPQVWARELDAGRYHCSMSTMYRIARAAGQSRERRRLASHPTRVRPELVATGPGQVWSWDITALRGPVKGVWFKCYVIIDIYSRYVTGWLVAASEDAVVARDFLADAITRNGIEPHTIHADRGGAMTSKPVSEMLVDLGVLRSHSRPRTSNDNPYSEAQFKTMKYVPDFPGKFGSLADARAFCDGFFTAYNQRTPAFRDRLAHPRIGALRHRQPDPRATPGHPRRGSRRAPWQVQPPATRTQTPRPSVDQPANPTGTDRLNLT
jgi:putative transposase